MSDTPKVAEGKEPKKKKGGKLPIIIALVVVLAGGGFFMMKGKGPKEPPPIKLGTIEPLEGEFLVNLQEPNIYLRAVISLHVKDGYKKEELDKSLDPVRAAIVAILRSKSIREVRTTEGMDKLRKQIVEEVNKILEAAELAAHPPDASHENEAEKGAAKAGAKAGAKDGAAKDSHAEPAKDGAAKDGHAEPAKDPHAKDSEKATGKAKEKDKGPAHPDWDSQTGPVLKLYFTSFATQ